MPQKQEKQFFAETGKENKGNKKEKTVSPEQKRKAIEYAKRIREIVERRKETGELFTEEDEEMVKRLERKIERIYSPIKTWEKEGKLTEKDVLAEYKAGGYVWAASFSPDGDKVVIGGYDKMMRVISLTETETDENGNTKPKVLAEYEAGGWVYAANFSPDGDKVVIGSDDKMMRVIG